MRTATSLPEEVREEDGIWIPMPDDVHLAGRVWRPVSSDDRPVPALLEFIPYRQRDLTAHRDSVNHRYLAGHGYACIRVDIRGSGDSEGILTGEYLERELTDAECILQWLREQPWCDGHLGMMGISWGGFNALQVAARRPPGLDAIVAVCSSDDRYADDVHYMGGCLLSDNLSWASTMFAYTSCPPDPAVVGDHWREMWHDRLHGSGLWLEDWLRHQHRDDFWKHGSVCEDYSAIQCPVFAVSGWADGYSNAVFRMLERLQVPRKGLIGPWSHKYPHFGQPGPAIGFLQEMVRWWDRWLKGVDNDVMDDPMLRIWMQESVPPSTAYAERPGRWVGEMEWPSPKINQVERGFSRYRMAEPGEPVDPQPLTVESPLSVGQFAGKWCSYNAPPDLPYDQREEDGGAIVFDSNELEERWEVLGAAVVNLEFSVTEPVAQVAVRLSDVAPDGRATRVSYGLLNLTHRTGHEAPEPLEPGRRYQVPVTLNGMAHAFPPGHRIRVAVSTSYWPLAWPPPVPVQITVYPEHSSLELPIRPTDHPDDVALQPFDEPEGTEPISTTTLRSGEHRWNVTRDLIDYRSMLEVVKDLGTVHFDDIDMDVSRRAEEYYSWVDNDFATVRGEVIWTMAFARDGWSVHTRTRTTLTSTPTEFHLAAELDAYEGEHRVAARNWHSTIRRDQV
ncbi:CocE/NonD family hydrolase [Phytoactinopolyspora halotolerans]|uniref:CocE/NonD family hydrolase n=1 Tax=Phytoactinopolyspora halotolerans TaxID=1981512 RepID=A0A6L9S2R0_9ACTN|nr:CocE/NonD family hydrolase [Phytoactinopolyspora halotolerans]NED99338.1 CocE/NonD family hydrolase [Phytoactinopolyspora halotolerans]